LAAFCRDDGGAVKDRGEERGQERGAAATWLDFCRRMTILRAMRATSSGKLPFVKMHGLGNDFVVIDARWRPVALTEAATRAIADRHTGVGCDQLIVVEPAPEAGADAFMRIRNADGGEVGACGNAARCVASLLLDESGRATTVIDTAGGRLVAEKASGGRFAVDMGPPRLDWREVPLARAMDTLHLELAAGPLRDPVAVSMGNPHAVFFVDDVAAIPIATLGLRLEHDALFPERANIGVAQVTGRDALRLRVWERGAGLTLACGTGACAAAVAASRRGLVGRRVAVTVDGGRLDIDWRADGHVMMTGPVATSFHGEIDKTLLP
jgi:diaminopimelate epimerase